MAFFGSRQFQDALDMLEADATEISFGQFDGATQKAASDGPGQYCQRLYAKQYRGRFYYKVGGFQAGDFPIPVGFLTLRPRFHVGEGLRQGGIPVTRQLRKQFVADAVAGEFAGGVRRVFPPGDAAIAEILLDLAAVDVEQRAYDAFAGDRANASQAEIG